MHRVKRFVEQQRRETEARISRRGTGSSPGTPSLSFLQGRLEALKLTSRYIDHLEEKEVLLNGTASTFSPQG